MHSISPKANQAIYSRIKQHSTLCSFEADITGSPQSNVLHCIPLKRS